MDRNYKTVKELLNAKTNEDGLLRIAEMCPPENCVILIENSTRSHFVERYFRKLGYSVIVAVATDLTKITKSDTKNDKIDARKLAEYAKEYQMWDEMNSIDDEFDEKAPFITCLYLDTEGMMKKTMCRQAVDLSFRRANIQKQIKEYMSMQNYTFPESSKSVKTKKSLRYLMNCKEPVLSAMGCCLSDVLAEEEENRKNLYNLMKDDEYTKLLMTIKGMGFASATYLSISIGDIKRFGTADSFVKFLGINPKTRESADKCEKVTISKQGDKKLRKVLYNIVRVHCRFCDDTELSKYKKRITEQSGKRVGTVAAARKLACIIWAMLTKGEPFRARPTR